MQAAGRHVAGVQRLEPLRQPHPFAHRRLDQAGIVEHQTARHLDLEIASLAGELPCHPPARAEPVHDALVGDQIRRGRGHAVRGQVRRGSHHHLTLQWPDRHRDHAARQAFAQADAGVETAGDQIGQRGFHEQLHLDLRVTRQETGQVGQHQQFGGDPRRVDAQLPGGHIALLVQILEGRIDAGQALAHLRQETGALLGQADPARGPLQQPHAEVRLQRADRLGERRGRHPQLIGGPGEAGMVRDAGEGDDGGQGALGTHCEGWLQG